MTSPDATAHTARRRSGGHPRGGGIANVGDVLLASIPESVYARSLLRATRDLRIVRSVLDVRGGLVGAVQMVADELFSRTRIGTWLPADHPSACLRSPTSSRRPEPFAFLRALASRGLKISALSFHGNPLHPDTATDLSSERTPHADPSVRGTFYGLHLGTTFDDLVR